MQKIMPCLWFDHQAEEAAQCYVAIFSSPRRPGAGENSARILNVARYGEAGAKVSGKPKGSVMTAVFQLDGQNYMALNGGPMFKLSPAMSLMINCQTQDEIDYFWNELCAGGKPEQCGWLTDRFGVSWQIVPNDLRDCMQDPQGAERAMQAVLKMKKLDIKGLQDAYARG